MLTHIFRRQDPYNILNYRNQFLSFLFGTELKKWIVSLERAPATRSQMLDYAAVVFPISLYKTVEVYGCKKMINRDRVVRCFIWYDGTMVRWYNVSSFNSKLNIFNRVRYMHIELDVL